MVTRKGRWRALGVEGASHKIVCKCDSGVWPWRRGKIENKRRALERYTRFSNQNKNCRSEQKSKVIIKQNMNDIKLIPGDSGAFNYREYFWMAII
jgi:hypothetical protein